MLGRKLRRELLGHWGQNLAIILAMALAVAFYVASRGSYLNLIESYAAIQEQLNLADWTLGVRDLNSAQIELLAELDGVAGVEDRQVISLPLQLPEARLAEGVAGALRLEGRFISLPADHPPRLNQLLIESGSYPEEPTQVLVEKHFADYHNLQAGAELELEIPGTTATVPLTVAGVAVSAEYLWVSRSHQDVLPSPSSFGILWMDRDALRRHLMRARLRAGLREMLGGNRTEGEEGPANPLRLVPDHEVLVKVAPDYEPRAVLNAVIDRLGEEAVLTATAREDLPQMVMLRTDLNSMRGFAIFFPILFLVVGGSIIATFLARTVDAQRTLIGTMLAFGVPRGRLLWHYFAFALIIGLFGILAGSAFGVFAGDVLTREYAQVANLPTVTLAIHEMVIVWGAGFGLSATLLAGLLPAYRVAGLLPSQAMRPPAPILGRGVSMFRRLGGLPLLLRLAIRNIVRRPGRTTASVAGVVTALVLVLAGAGVIDGFHRAVDILFQESWRYDLRADFFALEDRQALETRVREQEGVGELESLLTLPVSLQFGEQRLETVVEGLPPESQLVRPVNYEGQEVRPEDGVIMPLAMARKLGVETGDRVTIRLLPEGPEANLPIDGLTEGFGPAVYQRLDEAQKTFASSGLVNTVVMRTNIPTWEVRRSLQQLPQVARLQDLNDLRDRIDVILEFDYLLMGTMLTFSAILGLAILFTTSTLNITERRHELATMRALGMPFRRIVGMVTLEHLLIGALGLLLGLPLGVWTIRGALNLYENDVLTLTLVLDPKTFLLATANMLVFLLLAQWPALRTIARLNLADTVREFEQM